MAPEKRGHYKVAALQRWCALRSLVRSWADPSGCHLWLAAPDALVLDYSAQTVAHAWGFTPKQILHWRKVTQDETGESIGGGNYMRMVVEPVLLCTLDGGDVLRPAYRGASNWIDGPLTEHSRKPDSMFRRIQTVSQGPYLEMFARGALRPDWDAAWGNEVER